MPLALALRRAWCFGFAFFAADFPTAARLGVAAALRFAPRARAGGCASAQSEACSRLISLALRSGVSPNSIVEQLRGIRCPSVSWDRGQAILSCPDAIGGVLQRQLRGEEENDEENDEHDNPFPTTEPIINLAGQCPECSSLLIYTEGCLVCRSCGYTKCG